MKHTFYEYQNNLCSGEDYIKNNLIGENDNGEILPIKLRNNRFLYAIKRTLKDYDDIEYNEYKVYDLDSKKNACIHKEKTYLDNPPTLEQFWDKLIKFNSEMKNYVESRIEFGD